MLGVTEVIVGYTGGKTAFPTYRSIKDHTEGVRITFDPNVTSYTEILEVFFEQLGSSIYSPSYGCQYRSAILVHNEEQRAIASQLLALRKRPGQNIYVDIEPAGDFYRAEEYHQKYYAKSENRY